VLLTDEEYAEAVAIGEDRRAVVIRDGLRDHYRTANAFDDGVRLQRHIDGAVAERAFVKWSGQPWTGRQPGRLAPKGAADVGKNIQVRFRPNPLQPDLSVALDDPDDHVYVLAHRPVADNPMLVRFVGWMKGSLAKKVVALVGGVYYVPVAMLNPMPSRPRKEIP